MTVSLIEESEIPEFYSHITLSKGFKTADGTSQIQMVAAGHHPKMRITRAQVTVFAGSVAVAAVIEDGDGNDATSSLSSGTTAFATTEATLVAGQYFDRNEAVMIKPSAAGTDIYALYIVELESIH
jgi:hypothetical protein